MQWKNNLAGESMQRVVVVGTSCSGKTTLARQLSQMLGVPHIELDAVHWLPNWQPRPTDEFRRLVAEAVAGESWVMDGNYSSTARDIVWDRATTLIWLNYPFRVVFWRALRRTVLRVANQEELYSGNRETFRHSFLSRESIILWAITTYHRRRREYRRILDEGVFPHLRVIELRSPAEAEALAASLGRPSDH
jgi:adenylate kinase family enzyme